MEGFVTCLKKNATAFQRHLKRDCGDETYEELIVARIAADSIEEALVYLRRWRPDFEVMSLQRIGLVTLLSGAPLD
jgi:hypothetical protein